MAQALQCRLRKRSVPMKTSTKTASASVLLVEDDAALGASTSAFLETQHYDVTRSRSRMSSLTTLLDNRFDVVLLDLNLGGGDFEGLRIIEAARRAGITVPPVVIVSGQSLAAIGRAAAVIDTPFFVQKPFIAEDLTRVIQRALGSDRGLHIANQSPARMQFARTKDDEAVRRH
jgi:DNA-binding response OmpR family regulator